MIIALTAPKGSGKDLTADYIVDKYNYEKMAYADHLKDILRLMFDFSDKELYGTQKDKEKINEEWGISARQTALALGDFMRYDLPNKFEGYREKMEENYFVYMLMKKISNSSKNVIVSDVRFNNEIVELRKKFPQRKIKCIRILRNTDGFNTETDKHHSEDPNNIDNDQIDHVIDNNGTVEELYQKIDKILKE